METILQSYNIRIIWPVAKALFFVSVPIVLLILPIDYFDVGESVCLSKVIFDFECYACGMTRAIQHLIHFDFDEAIQYNPLSLIVLPIMIYIGIAEIYKSFLQIKKISKRSIK